LKVLQLISSGGFFGAETVLFQLALELKKQNEFSPLVAVTENVQRPHLEVAEECLKNGIETAILRCRRIFDPRPLAELRRLIKDHNIAVIHSHGYKADIYSFLATLGLGVPLVATCHNWVSNAPKMKVYEALDCFCLRHFDRVVAVSGAVMEKVIAGGIRRSKVTIVQNGISIERFERRSSSYEIRNELGITGKDPVIGTVGRISEEKGHRILLDVARDIIEQHPGALFLIVGDGPLRGRLEEQYSSSSIIFTGVRNDVPELLQCMDIFALPSFTEGLPIALLEAMASGIPVIASRVGSIPIVVEDGATGLLIDPGNQTGLKQAIRHLLDNKIEAAKMAKNGQRSVVNRFSSKKMAEEYLGIYKSVVAPR
jgi:glycosyltransferase involved in cell wall biosynthesis